MVGKRWRMDETYVKVKGQWRYLYRAVEKNPGFPFNKEKTAHIRSKIFNKSDRKKC